MLYKDIICDKEGISTKKLKISFEFKLFRYMLLLVFIILFRYLGIDFSTADMYSYRSKIF